MCITTCIYQNWCTELASQKVNEDLLIYVSLIISFNIWRYLNITVISLCITVFRNASASFVLPQRFYGLDFTLFDYLRYRKDIRYVAFSFSFAQRMSLSCECFGLPQFASVCPELLRRCDWSRWGHVTVPIRPPPACLTYTLGLPGLHSTSEILSARLMYFISCTMQQYKCLWNTTFG